MQNWGGRQSVLWEIRKESMAAGNQQKHLEFPFSLKAPSFHSRTSMRAHKHIFQYLKWLYCRKSREETFLIFNETVFLFWCHAV